MGSLGLPEIIFILVLALLIFGPKRLPEIGRTLGKGMAEFRKASNELKRTINTELSLDADEQTPHPRRIESPVPSIMQAMAPPASMTSETSPTPELYSAAEIAEAPVASVPWTPQAPPAGTIPQTSQTSPIPPIPPLVSPAPFAGPDPLAEAHDPTLPSHTSHTDPIEPS